MNYRLYFFFVAIIIWSNSLIAQKTSKTISTKSKESKVVLRSDKSTQQFPEYFTNTTTSTDSTFQKLFNQYYTHLLKNEPLELDQLEEFIETQTPQYLNDFEGYFGLRKWLQFGNSNSEKSDHLRNEALEHFQKAAETSIFTPKELWKNLAAQIQNQLSYLRFDDQIKIIPTSLNNIIEKNKGIEIISFSSKTGSRNLLLSQGSNQTLKVLDWDFGTQKWILAASQLGLDSIKGGNKIYAGDINQDGQVDFIILRNSSKLKPSINLLSSVLLSKKNGSYEDISQQLGIQKLYNAQFAGIGDINQDGRMDIVMGNKVHTTQILIQNSNGKFVNQSSSFIVDDFRNLIKDGLLTDLDSDGRLDILLTAQDGDNIAYLQNSKSTNSSIKFTNQADSLEISSLNFNGNLLQGSLGKTPNLVFMLKDVNSSLNDFSKILNKKDTSFHNAILSKDSKSNSSLTTLPNELSLLGAGVWIPTFNGMRLLFSGGQTVEEIFPFFEYNSVNQSIKIAQNPELPFYVQSAAVIEYQQQPVFIFAGGGNFPVMKTNLIQFEYRLDSTGKYHRIFDAHKEKIGSIISYIIKDNKGKEFDRTITVQARDSKGQNALQEWIWLPNGYTLQSPYYQPLQATPTGNGKVEKKNFEPRIQPNLSPSKNGSLKKAK